MEEKRIRRVVVIDRDGACRGIVTQADVARVSAQPRIGDRVRDVSELADSGLGRRSVAHVLHFSGGKVLWKLEPVPP